MQTRHYNRMKPGQYGVRQSDAAQEPAHTIEGSDRMTRGHGTTSPDTGLTRHMGRRMGQGLLIASFCLSGQIALAQDLVYTPINPSFGGSPLNSSHLLSTANAQRTATARDANDDEALGGAALDTPGTSNADLFVRQLEGRLLSALAGQVTDAIFGDNPQDGGLVTFGTTTVEFQRTLDSIRLVIIDSLDGTVTEIIVPQLVTNG